MENVVSALCYNPKKLIYIGYSKIMTKKKMADLERFFMLKNRRFEIEYVVVSRYDFDDIYNKILSVIENNRDCVFDLTGGKELVLAAMGALSAAYDIPMLQYDIKGGEVKKIKNCGNISNGLPIDISIDEMIVLNGGVVERNESKNLIGQVDSSVKNDIIKLWEICKKDLKLWNKQAALFMMYESYGISKNLELTVNLNSFNKNREDVTLNKKFREALEKSGLIENYNEKNSIVRFSYKNDRIRKWLTKAGNILEIYTYIIANDINQETPDYYSDIDIGVYIDWDGIVDKKEAGLFDTKNEIDIMLMRGLTPVFISCKNGDVQKEALYELESVANKFGGEYAKKYIVTSNLSSSSNGHKRHFLRRAHDMKIIVIDDINEMQYDEFKDKFKRTVT